MEQAGTILLMLFEVQEFKDPEARYIPVRRSPLIGLLIPIRISEQNIDPEE